MSWLPSPRLIVACLFWALLALLAVVWGWQPPVSVVLLWAAIVLVGAIGGAVDAYRSRALWEGVTCLPRALQRLALDKAGAVELPLHLGALRRRRARVGVAWPTALGAKEVLQEVVWDAGAQRVVIAWELCPVKRGRVVVDELRMEVPTAGGWGRMRKSLPVQWEFRVFANMDFDQRVLSSFLMREGLPGLKLQRFRGLGREFDQLRDYEPSDSMDTIHWKASARRGSWVTKMYQLETTQDIYAIVDVSSSSQREIAYPGKPGWRMPCLERSVQCATLLGQTAVHNKDKFGLVSFDDRVRSFVKAGMGMQHLTYCQQVLSEQQSRSLVPDFAEVFTSLATRLRRRALLFFLIDISDPVVSQKLLEYLPILTRKHLVHISYCVAKELKPVFAEEVDVSNAAALYDVLGEHALYQQLREFQAQCTRLGASVGMYPSDGFSLQSVQQYLNLKSRQLL